MDRDLTQIGTVMPGRLKMRTTGEQHQQGRGWCLINQQIQQFQGCRVCPEPIIISLQAIEPAFIAMVKQRS